MMRPMTKPFAGIRILDFTRYVAGPYGTYQLALLGADVVKIEPKTGDEMRQSQVSKDWAAKGLGPSFMGINANKRSLTLDLQKPKAAEIVRRLAKDADIVWETFRPGVMDRFGLGYEALKAINPRLIYCAVSGFGQNGPERGTARVRPSASSRPWAASCRSPATRIKARPVPALRCATRSAR